MSKTLTIVFQKIDGCNNPMNEELGNAHGTMKVESGGETLLEENGQFLIYDCHDMEDDLKYLCPITKYGERMLSNIETIYKIFKLDWDKDVISIVDEFKERPCSIVKVVYDLN